MDYTLYQKFADSMLSLVTDFPMNAEEIETAIKTQGLDRFIRNISGQAFELFEIAELLLIMENGGERLESELSIQHGQ